MVAPLTENIITIELILNILWLQQARLPTRLHASWR
eukprot:COSAG02_NODE_65987_length_256_cov_1.305732_1_plen_35_part_01